MPSDFGYPSINIQQHSAAFKAKKEYIQNNSTRLPAALISYYYLLHIADSIYNTGSGWATWQYPIERLCGMLLPLVCSMQHPYTILQNQITMWTQFYTFNINLIYIKSLLKYGKLQTKNELIINSKLSSRKGDVTRTNYCISYSVFIGEFFSNLITKLFAKLIS
uniref:Uncharacterized protein n=1 Tax=Rhizophagus irregularis (strain DAOM 181602 / DAOM 197198 / MUCL 43194) TaxID=747089 RepID=U9SID2_RHIID